MHGMQKVRGSNPLSSTRSQAYKDPGEVWLGANVGAKRNAPAMSRRGFRDDAIYFDHSGDCRDARYHKGCPGRWRGAVSLGYGPDGKRIRRKVGGRTKQEVKDKLEALHADLKAGISAPNGRYTVGQAIEDWLRDGLQGRAEKTVTLNRGGLGQLLIGDDPGLRAGGQVRPVPVPAGFLTGARAC